MITDEQQAALLEAACKVRGQAYARYSNYKVGAAVMTPDGKIFTGVNVENASFGLTICAERAAIFNAVSQGHRRFTAVAVCSSNAGSPCGACRQVISEFTGDVPIYMSDIEGNFRVSTLHTLLPDYFTLRICSQTE